MKEYAEIKNIPQIAFGTARINNNDVVEIIKTAIESGYRHIDTAQLYNNEIGVGFGIKGAVVNREDIFITSKIDAHIKTYDAAMKSIDKSIDDLGLDYIDLMLIHGPQPWHEWSENYDRYFAQNIEVYKALEMACKQGKVKAIGLSNFLEVDVLNILNNCNIKPAVNQILANVNHMPYDLIDLCSKNNILVQAYAPLENGQLLSNETVNKIAIINNVTPAEVCIQFLRQQDLAVVVKASTPSRMKQNLGTDFILTDEELMELSK